MEKKDDTLKHTHTHKTDRIRMRTSNSTLIVGKFNISISIMDRTINRKSIKKENLSNNYKLFRIKDVHEHFTEYAYIKQQQNTDYFQVHKKYCPDRPNVRA